MGLAGVKWPSAKKSRAVAVGSEGKWMAVSRRS